MNRVSNTVYSKGESGGVLITVLLLVTFMSTLAVSMIDDVRASIKQTSHVRLVNQAQWFARGAEELAEQAIALSWVRTPGRSTLQDAWTQGPTVFPVDGGYIEGRILDRSNCFNLNNVVEEDGADRYVRREAGVDQFQRLLLAIGIAERDAEPLVAALVDWVDSDSASSNRGAEDAYYISLSSPYRTANTLILQPSELRAIKGYTESVYLQVLPFVCAQPHTNPSPLNVNTLLPEQSPLLTMLVGTQLVAPAARQVVLERPDGGFRSLQTFWSHRAFSGLSVSEQMKGQVSVRTRYFESRAEVVLGQAFVSVTTLFEQSSDGSLRKVLRHQGLVP